MLLTKYEIITDFFCDNLPKSSKKIKKLNQNGWEVVNEFLSLKYPSGALSSKLKSRLVETILSETEKCLKIFDKITFNGVLILLQHQSMLNFYKSNSEIYGKLISKIFEFYTEFLKNETSFVAEEEENVLKTVIENLLSFIKYKSDFQEVFTKEVLKSFSELIIVTRNSKISIEGDYFKILQLIYFSDENIGNYKNYFTTKSWSENIFEEKTLPKYVSLLTYEGFILSYRDQSELTGKFVKFLFDDLLTSDQELESYKDLLISLNYSFQLLKKHGIQLLQEVDGIRLVNYLGDVVNELVDKFYNSYQFEVLSILCSIIKLNPIILEQNIFQISVKCMLSRKDDRIMEKYEEFLCLFVDMFQKLSRSQNLLSYLIKALQQQLSSTKLSKKLKRKLNSEEDDLNTSKNSKKRRTISTTNENGSSEEVIDFYLNHLTCEDTLKVNRAESTWNDLYFAWPSKSVGVKFSSLISSLVSKPSLKIWKTLVYSLSQSIVDLKSTESDENTIFLIDFISSLLCQYFTGTRLAEQSDKFWDLIQENRDLTHELLKDFGNYLLSIEHNSRLMNSFLQICYSAGNFDLICWFYCPDSINTTDNLEYTEIPVVDLKKKAKNIHEFLTSDEWVLIEQRIINFGKDECKTNLNKLYLQKIRSNLLFSCNKKKMNLSSLLTTALTDYQQMKPILMDPATNMWFIELLTRDQKMLIADVILKSEDAVKFIGNILENKEFTEILIFSLFQKVAKDGLNSKKSVLNGVNFEKVFSFDITVLDEIKLKIAKRIEDQAAVKKFEEDDLRTDLIILKKLPLEYLSQNIKNFVFALTLGFYVDLKSVGNDELKEMCLDIFGKLIQSGDSPNIFKFFEIELLIEIFKDSKIYKSFFELIFENPTKHVDEDDFINIRRVLEMFKENNSEDLLDLCMTIPEFLPKIKKAKLDKSEIHLFQEDLITSIIDYLVGHLTEENKKVSKKFLARTLSGFSCVLTTHLGKKENLENLNDDVIKICKVYVKNSINSEDPCSIRLIKTVLTFKKPLKMEQEEVDEILKTYWEQFLSSIRDVAMKKVQNFEENIEVPAGEVSKNLTEILKIIVANKSDKQLEVLMKDLWKKSQKVLTNVDICYFSNILACLGKCGFSNTKSQVCGFFFCLNALQMIEETLIPKIYLSPVDGFEL